MFESAELGHKVDKQTYKAEVPGLREALLNAQYELLDKKAFSLVIVIGGVDGAGKGETGNVLNAWMDARHIRSYALDEPTDEERVRPPMWRFWRALPPKGKTAMFYGSWYTQPIVRRALGETKNAELDQSTEEIRRFERMLVSEGALILKFWFHLSKEQQKARLDALEKSARTRWRVRKKDWDNYANYDKFKRVSERTLRLTSTAEAPWTVVEGVDARYRNLTVTKTLLGAMQKRLAEVAAPVVAQVAPAARPVDDKSVLRALDLDAKLDPVDYKIELARLQRKLNLLTRHADFSRVALIAVFEGPDAAGKGGAIRRITGALDARQYRVTPIAAPTEEERSQPYLWRFWRHLPPHGKMHIFDRSWYGRVLVERVEGFCAPDDWQRAYSEINDFEEQLVSSGTVLVKFWLHIGKNEQLARFEARESTAFKRFKITTEDWRNRDKWDAYEEAVREMVDRTSTEIAPWSLVAANDKRWARVKVLREITNRLERVL